MKKGERRFLYSCQIKFYTCFRGFQRIQNSAADVYIVLSKIAARGSSGTCSGVERLTLPLKICKK